MGWAHYEDRTTHTLGPGHVSVDYWPDVSESTPGERFATAFKRADGHAAELFSSHNSATVDRHFRWMEQYGIDGAFVQRFSSPIIGEDAPSRRRLRATDDVLGFVMSSAERHGRTFAVMYDLSGMRAGAMSRVMADWRHVNDALHVRTSRAYQFHRGKPVVIVWGIGFNDGRAYSLTECAALLEFLKNDPRYGGNTVMLGIPTWWREQTTDATPDPELHAVLAKADILSPWTPGRYSDLGGVAAHAERFWQPDRAWCDAHGIDYMPVVFPGFSWRNLKRTDGGIERNDGRFLWAQYRALINGGAKMIYQAMFDEMDEGTQIFKVTNDPPPGAFFRTYTPLPSDYYLTVVGLAARHLHAGTAVPERLSGENLPSPITAYLRQKDDAEYTLAAEQSDARRRFFAIDDALAGKGSLGDQIRVTARGHWSTHHRGSSDPEAALTWELPVSTSGPHAIAVRFPAYPNDNHGVDAVLRVTQGDRVLLERSISDGPNPSAWQPMGEVTLEGGSPCVVDITKGKSGRLVLIEPRLVRKTTR
jgi:hypothetical protein